ncbi:hypothetical protein RJ55_05292 [Drechmeria coniospora]|nr:hypothetical protein RJ55_05292 [Drechmeria coniospora]
MGQQSHTGVQWERLASLLNIDQEAFRGQYSFLCLAIPNLSNRLRRRVWLSRLYGGSAEVRVNVCASVWHVSSSACPSIHISTLVNYDPHEARWVGE